MATKKAVRKAKFELLGDAKEQKLAMGSGGVDPIIIENYRVSREVAQTVLVVANSNSADSLQLLDYYFMRRPWFYYFASRMQIDCPPTESITIAQYNLIEQAILAHPKINQIKYIILLLDVPSRVPYLDPGVPYGFGESVSSRLWKKFNKQKYITHVNMGTLEDCKAYIRKLALYYNNTPFDKKSIYISGRNSGLAGNKFWFDDAEAKAFTEPGKQAYVTILHTEPTYYVKNHTRVSPHFWRCEDVIGYLSWGWNGGMHGNYAVPFPEPHGGKVRFSGKSGWYLIQTIESYNGRREVHQGHFTQWFSELAFGGSNWSNTPICAVTHVEEPGLGGINQPTILWKKWIDREIFAKCAWDSVVTPNCMMVGDPLVII